MAKNTIEVILKGRNETGTAFKVLGLSLTDLKSGLSMVTGGLRQFQQGVKAAFDFTQEGAAIIQTRQSFERLGLSIDEMRAASLGTVDDMTLMKASLTLTAGASEGLQAHLLQNAPALMEIAKAANAVNPLLGDTAYMYDSIATGIKRGSPLILDNLGIMVKVGEANEIYAAQVGKTVEQLSAEEKSIALLNAALVSGNRLMEQAGGTAESFTDAWARLRVEIKNTTDEAKAQSAEGVQPLISQYADFLQITRENEDALIGFGGALRFASYMLTGNEEVMNGASFAWKALTLQWDEAAELLKEQWGLLDEQAEKLTRSGEAAEKSAGKHGDLNDQLDREYRAIKKLQGDVEKHRTLISNLGNAQADLSNDILTSAEAWDQYSAAIAGSEQAMADYYTEANRVREVARQQAIGEANVAAVQSDLTERLEEGSAALGELYDERADILRQIEELTAANGRAVTTQAHSNLTEAEATLVTLQLADAQAKLAAETDPMKIAQLAVKVEDLQGKLGGATGATTTFIDNTKKIGELQGQYAALGDEIDGVTGAIKETIDAFILQQLQSRLAIGGWNEAENELFITVAQGMGMYDQLHADRARTLFDMAAGVDAVGESEEQAMANAKAYAIEILGMSEEMANYYVDQAVAAGQAAEAVDDLARASDGVHESISNLGKDGPGALSGLGSAADEQAAKIAGIAAASDGVHERISNLGKGGKTALDDITDAAGTQIEQLLAVGTAADTTYGQISSLGKDGAVDLAEISTEAQSNIDKIDALGESGTATQILLTTMTKTVTGELVSLATQSDTTLGGIKTLGEEGAQSLSDIDTAARSNADRLDAVGLAADNAQTKINAMTGKDIFIDVYVREHGIPGSPGSPGVPGGPGSPQATGGDYFVNSPTPFIAGDKGWERAIFIPRGQPGYDAGTTAAAVAAASAGGTSSTNNSRTVNIINPLFQGSQQASVRALSQMEF